jgi:hypothetical protein
LYREDRVECSRGEAFLRDHKIREDSATNRVVAACCNSAMFLNFDDGKHWVSVYRAWFQGVALPLQMRICTQVKPQSGDVTNDVRGYSGFPLKFVVKLVTAKIAMLLLR